MKKSKLSESQMVAMLNEAESGAQINELCRRYQISAATYYKLKNRYSGMSISELKRVKELEAENQRLKTMYANISLEYTIVKDVLEKKYPGLIDKK